MVGVRQEKGYDLHRVVFPQSGKKKEVQTYIRNVPYCVRLAFNQYVYCKQTIRLLYSSRQFRRISSRNISDITYDFNYYLLPPSRSRPTIQFLNKMLIKSCVLALWLASLGASLAIPSPSASSSCNAAG